MMSTSPPHDTVTPDVETSSDAYRLRFAGPAGRYLLDRQTEAVSALLNGSSGPLRVLEVGGGHGQLTRFLLDRGHAVWVQGSDASCVEQIRPMLRSSGGRLRFAASGLWSLPFGDGSFDLVIAIRLLSHVERWEALLEEMGRVTRRLLLVDYASRTGWNLLTPLLFRAKRRLEGNTRPYFCYTGRQLMRCLNALSFQRFAFRKQFWAPMGLHRVLGSPRCSRVIEGIGGALGMTRVLGSPVLLLAEKG